MLIKIKDEQGEEQRKGIPATCGDCDHCAPVDIHLPKLHAMAQSVNSQYNGWYRGYRCQHHRGLDYKGKRTAVNPWAPPPAEFCPMMRGLAKHMSQFHILGLGED